MRCADTRVSQVVPILERWTLFCTMTYPMCFGPRDEVGVHREIDSMRF